MNMREKKVMRDLYSHNSICYINDASRIGFSFGLATESCRLFKKTILFKNFSSYESMVIELGNLAQRGESIFNHPIYDETWKFSDASLHDSIITVAAFENFFKSVLLKEGFLIHIPSDKEMRDRQKREPLLINDYIKNDRIFYDEAKCINRFGKLQESSLQISTLINKNNYKEKYSLSESLQKVLQTFVVKRNTIHFLAMGSVTAFSKDVLASNRLVYDYFNGVIIPWQNKMAEEAGRGKEWNEGLFV